jgi:probable HAF family extracellular repeat protein
MRTKLFFLIMATLTAARAGAVTYTAVDLGSTYQVNGHQSKIINDLGEVIGNELGTNGHAFLYSGQVWNDLDHVNSSGSGNHGSLARGINNLSLVVGQGDNGNSAQTDGFFRSGAGGTTTTLGLVGGANLGQNAIAYACNDHGTILGNVIDDTTGLPEMFLFQPGTGVVARQASGLYTFALNRFGDVLGNTVGIGPKSMVNGVGLPTATAGFTPHAINNAGQVLLSGDSSVPTNRIWGMILQYGTGKITNLGNLHPKSAGYTSFLDINDAGQVVGRGADENTDSHAVLYNPGTGPGTGLISLDALGLTVDPAATPIHLLSAEGINNAGQIVCTGYVDDPDVIHAFLLTPDAGPPPPTLEAAYDGLASVGGLDLGLITITVNKNNSFTAKLTAPGVSYSFTALLTNGAYTGTITVNKVALTITLQANSGLRKITGQINDGLKTYDLDARRQMKVGIFAGKMNALLQISNPTIPDHAQGIGYGVMTVTKADAITVVGQFGDGTKFSAAGTPHTDGTWTFYVPLYPKPAQPGAMAGFLTFDRGAVDSDCGGTLKWIKPGDFATEVSFKAALYTTVTNKQVLRFNNATAGGASLATTGGDQTPLAHTLLVTNKNVVTVTDPSPADLLKVTLTSSSGVFTGTFKHSGSGKVVTFNGLVQQKLNIAGGVFQGPTKAGSVLLTPQ